jgi:hypothetical protein
MTKQTQSSPWEDAIARNEVAIAELQRRRDALNRQIEAKQRYRSSLEAQRSLSNSWRRPGVVPPGQKLTAKTLGQAWAWSAILAAFEKRGMPPTIPRHVARDAMKEALNSHSESTLRSYVKRFVERGLLTRTGAGLALTEKGKQGVQLRHRESSAPGLGT